MRSRVFVLGMLIAVGANAQSTDSRIAAPRFWNDRELADCATPVAGLNVRPGHFSERDYYLTSLRNSDSTAFAKEGDCVSLNPTRSATTPQGDGTR